MKKEVEDMSPKEIADELLKVMTINDLAKMIAEMNDAEIRGFLKRVREYGLLG